MNKLMILFNWFWHTDFKDVDVWLNSDEFFILTVCFIIAIIIGIFRR